MQAVMAFRSGLRGASNDASSRINLAKWARSDMPVLGWWGDQGERVAELDQIE
jgi:hypothetical protein